MKHRLLIVAAGGALTVLIWRLARLNRRDLREDGPRVLLDHLTQCHPVDAVIAQDGNADDTVLKLLAAGWTIEEGADFVAGKRVRYMHPPASDSPEMILRALRGDDHGR